jgi:folate-binding protein YgfZ
MTADLKTSRALATEGWFDRSDRVRVEVAGPDRAKLLHNLVTHDIKRLPEGSGREAFVTSPQGKTLAYVSILAGPATILLRSDPGTVESFLPHLEKYGVFDDATIGNVSASTFEFHLVGRTAELALGKETGEPLPEADLGHRMVTIAGVSAWLICEGPTGQAGWTLVGPASVNNEVAGWLERSEIPALDSSTFDFLRIVAGTPVSGRDVTPANLPQEVGRDARAISFVKGCYLGQETVARLDALGHVNRILKGFRVEGERPPEPGTALVFEGKPVGTITSSAPDPGASGSVALGYVRVAQAVAGTRLQVVIEGRETTAIVTDLPMDPGA